MFKLISQVFADNSVSVDHVSDTGVHRMAKINAMRRRTEEVVIENGGTTDSDEADKKDILSRARDLEVGQSWKGYTLRGKDERQRRMGYIVKDWHDRISHLPGFKVDPEY